MSATEAEYIAASEAKMEVVWIRKFFSRLGIVPTIDEPIKMFCDNSAALLIANEPGVHMGSRHYHRRYLLQVHTDNNLANPFMKALLKGKLTQHARSMRLYGSSKRYSSMIRMLQGIDREDLEALWRIVKAKYGDTRPENEFERVLYGDLKVMFEPDIKSDVWRMLQGYRVTIWKLIDSSRVHFVRRNLKIQKMNIKFRGGLLGLKRLHGFLEVTAAQIQDYALWVVIENGDSWVPISQTTEENGITTLKMSTPATAEEKTKKKNDVKARGLLLMALPNEHQLTFSQYPNAKSMFAAIEIRVGGFRR
ncbi:hypothetical protein Tco_1369495 [Tanacetum coccineum]